MTEENQSQRVKVQVLDLAGYVPGVVTSLPAADVAVLEKKNAVRRLTAEEIESPPRLLDFNAGAANKKVDAKAKK